MLILDFKRLILAELPGNADLLVELHMVEGVKDLCRETFAYTERVIVPSVVDQSAYSLVNATADTLFVSFVGGLYDDVELEVTDKTCLRASDPSWRLREGTPFHFVYSGGASVMVDRIPQSIVNMDLELAIMPDKITSPMPEVIEQGYIEAVKNYVKWKVFSTDPINDLNKARLFEREYLNGRENLNREVLRNFSENLTATFEGFG